MADSYGTYALADVAAQVMGRDARLGARASVPLLGDDEITRFWKVDSHLLERVRAFLDLYGDGDHFIAGSPSVETHAITAPAVDQGVAQPGLWRIVRNFEQPDQPGLVFQTLRRGFLRPPSVSGTAWGAAGGADSEARIVRVQQVAPDVKIAFGTHYVVLYPHVDKTFLRQFTEELIGRGTIAAPVFDAQTQLPGAYTFRACRNAENEDGTSTVLAILASTTVPIGVEVQLYDGCAAKEWARFFWDLHTLPAVPASTSGIEYRLQNLALDRESGLWTCTLERVETKTLTLAKHTAAEDLFEKRERTVWQGVREGDLDHLGNSIALETPGIASDGAVVNLSRSKNRNCTQDIRQERVHELALAAAERAETKTLYEHTVEVTDQAQPAATDVTVPPAAGGVVVRKSVRKTRGNKRTISTRTGAEQPVTAAQKSETRTLFDVRTSQLDKAQPLATDLTAPAPADGVVVAKRGTKTDGGLMDVTTDLDAEQAVTQAERVFRRRAYSSHTRVVDRNQATAPADTVVPGVTQSVSKTPGNRLNVVTDTPALTPFLHEWVEPGYSGATPVKEFGFYPTAQFLALLASLGSACDWAISPHYDEEIDRWSGRITMRPLRIRRRGYWQEYYKTGIIETVTDIQHRHDGRVYKVVTQYTFNLRADNDIDTLFTRYAAETARKNGSAIHPDWANNRGTYKAVTAISATTEDVTDDYYLTGTVTL